MNEKIQFRYVFVFKYLYDTYCSALVYLDLVSVQRLNRIASEGKEYRRENCKKTEI